MKILFLGSCYFCFLPRTASARQVKFEPLLVTTWILDFYFKIVLVLEQSYWFSCNHNNISVFSISWKNPNVRNTLGKMCWNSQNNTSENELWSLWGIAKEAGVWSYVNLVRDSLHHRYIPYNILQFMLNLKKMIEDNFTGVIALCCSPRCSSVVADVLLAEFAVWLWHRPSLANRPCTPGHPGAGQSKQQAEVTLRSASCHTTLMRKRSELAAAWLGSYLIARSTLSAQHRSSMWVKTPTRAGGKHRWFSPVGLWSVPKKVAVIVWNYLD